MLPDYPDDAAEIIQVMMTDELIIRLTDESYWQADNKSRRLAANKPSTDYSD